MFLLDFGALQRIVWTWPVVWLLLGFTASQFISYSLVPLMMVFGGAALFNLSLLTADIYSLVASAAVFGREPSALYAVGALVVIVGLLIYASTPDLPQYHSEPQVRAHTASAPIENVLHEEKQSLKDSATRIRQSR